MKSFPYVLGKKALSVLEEIWLYASDKWSLEQSDRYFAPIFEEIRFICSKPNSGKKMDHVRTGYRAAKVKSHLIFYKVENETIQIIRILHERMDNENRWNDEIKMLE